VTVIIAMHKPKAATASRAYEFWQQRGCPHGSPEIDWYRAEREPDAACNEATGRGDCLTLNQEMKLRSFVKGFRQHRPHRLAMSVLRRCVGLGYVEIAGLLAVPTPKAQAFCATTPTLKLIDTRKQTAT
jgi:hypothetical protein